MSDVAAEIKVGDTAPDFNLKDQDQKDVKLSDYRGKKNVVLAFHPLAFTPVCATQMSGYESSLPRLEGSDAVVLGISIDSTAPELTTHVTKLAVAAGAVAQAGVTAGQLRVEVNADYLGGGYATFPGVVGTAVTKVCDLEVARTGLREADAAPARPGIRT